MRDNFNIADWRIQYLNGELLTESDAKIDQTKKIIRKIFSDLLDLEGPVSGSDYYVDGKQDTTWMQYLVYSVRHYFGLMSFDRSILKLLPVVARIAFEELKFEQESQDLNKLQFLNRVVNLALKDLNGDIYNWILQKGLTLTYQDLYNRFQEQFTAVDREESDKANNTEGRTRNEHYKIIPIVTFEEAHKWGEFSGVKGGDGKLCYAQGNSIWNTYIGEDNKCFLLLRDDWKETPAEKTKGYPKDSYGLSMVWVFVNKISGELTFSNVRWNHGDHSYNNVDHMFTPSEIADLLGMSYDKAFSINVDKDYFNKSLQALFDNNLNVAKQYFKLIVPVYEGYTFIDRTTGIRYYARSIREYYQIPDTSFSIEDGADFYPITGAGVNASNKISIFNFKTLKIEKEDIAKLLIPLKGIPVYGGKVVQYQSDMFYIRTEDSSIHKVPVPGTGFSIKDGADFYTIAGVNASNKISIFNFKTLKIEKEDLAKFLMPLKGTPVYGGKLVVYEKYTVYYIRTEDSSIHKVPEVSFLSVPWIKKNSPFYLTDDLLIFDFKTLKNVSSDENKIPIEFFTDKDLLKTLIENEVFTPVPGIESGKLFQLRTGKQWIYVPDGKSPIFSRSFGISWVPPLKTAFKLENNQYLLSDTFTNNALILVNTKTPTFKAVKVTEILPKLAEIFKSNPAKANELSAYLIRGADEDEELLYKDGMLISRSSLSHRSYIVTRDGTVYNLHPSYSFGKNFFYFRNDVDNFNDLVFYKVNLRTGKVSTMGKGLEGFHNIWVKTKGTLSSLQDIPEISVSNYPECSIISFSRGRNYQVWLPDGKVFPSIYAFYYSAKYENDQVFVKNAAPRSEFRKLNLNETPLTESLVDCILGNINLEHFLI